MHQREPGASGVLFPAGGGPQLLVCFSTIAALLPFQQGCCDGVQLVFLVLLGSAIALIIIGAVMDGMLYLLSTGVLLLIAAVLYLLVRSVSRSRRRPAH
ncbi:hypothetical protein [Streptomyces sp. NPDC001401]|uniref:hypothetical protein n=1 Tax=Streptomyces sp. NPDC001401 TaxID=3364570 RepID=UPI0036CAA412